MKKANSLPLWKTYCKLTVRGYNCQRTSNLAAFVGTGVTANFVSVCFECRETECVGETSCGQWQECHFFHLPHCVDEQLWQWGLWGGFLLSWRLLHYLKTRTADSFACVLPRTNLMVFGWLLLDEWTGHLEGEILWRGWSWELAAFGERTLFFKWMYGNLISKTKPGLWKNKLPLR